MTLPNYDSWKTHNPDDDRCEYCGADPSEAQHGWQPDACNGRCNISWRDPDAELERIKDGET
jgi:hypothetical protein